MKTYGRTELRLSVAEKAELVQFAKDEGTTVTTLIRVWMALHREQKIFEKEMV